MHNRPLPKGTVCQEKHLRSISGTFFIVSGLFSSIKNENHCTVFRPGRKFFGRFSAVFSAVFSAIKTEKQKKERQIFFGRFFGRFSVSAVFRFREKRSQGVLRAAISY